MAGEIGFDWIANDRGLLSISESTSCPNRTFFNYCNSCMTFSNSTLVAWSAWMLEIPSFGFLLTRTRWPYLTFQRRNTVVSKIRRRLGLRWSRTVLDRHLAFEGVVLWQSALVVRPHVRCIF